MNQFRGFTLIELVLVLVLTGILAAVVLPRLPVGGHFEQRLQADNLMGLLRLAQLRAMNDPGALVNDMGIEQCGRVVITQSGFSLSDDCDSAALLTSEQLSTAEQQGLFLGKTGLTMTVEPSLSYTLPLVVQFGKPAADTNYLSNDSRLGRPYLHRSSGPAPLSATMMITLGDKVVYIEPEGYIHAP